MRSSKGKVILGVLVMAVLLFAMSMGTFAENAKEEQENVYSPLKYEYEEGTAEYVIYNGLLNMDEYIDLEGYHLEWEKLEDIFAQVLNNNPELFYAVRYLDDWTYSEDEEYCIIRIYPEYLAPKEEIDTYKETFQKAVEKAISGVEDSWSELEKALYLHDYIVSNCDYDWYNYNCGTVRAESLLAYGCLVKGKAVSDGYTFAYAYLLHEVGIESIFITGWDHSWNAIKIDGNYYFVDLIWDDPIRYRDTGCCFDYVGHDYFLMTIGEILNEDNIDYHQGWTQEVDATDMTYYGAYFKKVDSPFSYYNGEWYFWYNEDNSYKKPVIAKTADLTKPGTVIRSLAGLKWYVIGKDEMAWKGYQGNVDVSVERGMLYYCTNSQIFSINLDDLSEAPRLLLSIDTDNGHIYGLRVDGDTLSYGISTSPYVPERWLTYDLNIPQPEFFTGDVNKDGEINADDALAVLKTVVGLESPDYEEWFADCDGNSQIDANDALWILKKTVGLL